MLLLHSDLLAWERLPLHRLDIIRVVACSCGWQCAAALPAGQARPYRLPEVVALCRLLCAITKRANVKIQHSIPLHDSMQPGSHAHTRWSARP